MAGNSSAGTSGPTNQTVGSVTGGGPQAMAALANMTPGQANIPAPANCVAICPPSSAMFNNPGMWSVNQTPTMEAISWCLYSYQAYPTAGATSFTFFQNPVGGGALTLEDTNMQAAGSLPSPQKFLVYGFGVDYLPGTAPIQGPRADAATSQINDVYAILRRGYFNFSIGEKSYSRIAPLMQLPTRAHINGQMSIDSQTTPAATLQVLGSFGFSDGDVYRPVPVLLEANQNFSVTIGFPAGVQAIPSGDTAARIGVNLYGVLYRAVQ